MKFFNFHDKIYLFALKQKSRQCFENLRFIYAPIVNKKKAKAKHFLSIFSDWNSTHCHLHVLIREFSVWMQRYINSIYDWLSDRYLNWAHLGMLLLTTQRLIWVFNHRCLLLHNCCVMSLYFYRRHCAFILWKFSFNSVFVNFTYFFFAIHDL